MTTYLRSRHLIWTPLGVRMGFTSEPSQREEILAAAEFMVWTDTLSHPPYLDGPAVRAIVAALFRHQRDHIQRVGVAQLNGGRQLIALQASRGGRSFVLDLSAEAIQVLVALPHLPFASHQSCVA